MFEFFSGIAEKIAAKTKKKNQVLYSTDTGVLSFDIVNKDTGEVTRYTVNDPSTSALDGKTVLIL